MNFFASFGSFILVDFYCTSMYDSKKEIRCVLKTVKYNFCSLHLGFRYNENVQCKYLDKTLNWVKVLVSYF